MKILVAGIGNIFQADDGFGVEVARRLARRELPPEVEVADFGIRGLDLAYTLLDGVHDRIYLVDLVKRGNPPGTLSVIEPEAEILDSPDLVSQAHGMDPAQVLAWVKTAGGKIDHIRLIGCEPEDLGEPEEVRVGLSPPVSLAVDQAIQLIERILEGGGRDA